MTVEVVSMSDEEYFSDTGEISRSMLVTFMKSPELYHAKYIAKSILETTSPALQLGIALHEYVLEGGYHRTVTSPKFGNSKAAKAEREAFLEENSGKNIITFEQSELVVRMAEALLASEVCRTFLKMEGHTEQVYRWTHSTGLKCKAKIDKVAAGAPIVIDLKSSSDATPEGFAKSVGNYRYDIQGEFYCMAAGATHFANVVVQSSYPHITGLYQLDAEDLEKARREIDAAMERLAECYATGDWSNPWANKVTTIKVPKWVRREAA